MPVMLSGLNKHFELIPCTTLDTARTALRKQAIDLIIAGIHFDESRMFDLLRYVQADPATNAIPVLCVKVLDDQIASTFLQAAAIASQALGAHDFVDFSVTVRGTHG